MGIKDFLQGKWMGHPLHPILVHVPMGLWPAALVADLFSFAGGGGNAVVHFSAYAILLGLLSAIVSIPAGWADWSGIKREKPAWKLGVYHMTINAAATLIWLGNFVLRLPGLQEAERVTALQLALSILGVAVLVVGAWFGKRMVFDQGTSVARQSKKKWRKIAEEGKSALPDK